MYNSVTPTLKTGYGGVSLKINTVSTSVSQNYKQNRYNPNFKSVMPILGATGSIMQWIESKGYFISFLIQDGLGMTAPRVWTGFHRDKEITGKYNKQEGIEVLGREGLTGPYIVGVAPAVLALSGRFCKSTNTNTRLIKRYGESLKELVKSKTFNDTIRKDKDKFKKAFFQKNLDAIYKNSVTNDKNTEETIKNLLKEFDKFDNADKKASEAALNNMVETINSKLLETSSDFYQLNKVYVGEGETKQAFSTKEALKALKDYANDAIKNNPNSSSIDETAAENIKNNFATKRLGVNIANVALTLIGLSYLPKLYAKSDVSPGAAALEHAKHQQLDSKEEVSFKGKGINSEGIIARLGKLITKNIPEKAQELLEYTGYNFSKTTFTLLSILGLILPRGKRAWDRAQIDANGKRDMTEINEILLRDTVSSLSVVFAVPMLTKMIVKSYEDKMGFVLTNRASDGKSGFKKFVDLINPYSKLEVLSVADLDSIYGNIDSKIKFKNFAEFVDKNGGDLEKIISKSDNADAAFKKGELSLETLKGLSRKDKNDKIRKHFESLSDDIIAKIMKGSGEIKHNKIAKMARGLNSLPGFISTVVISPILLGALIPMLTYHNTRKANAKKLKEMQS